MASDTATIVSAIISGLAILFAALVARRGIYSALSERKLLRKADIAADLFAYSIDLVRAIRELKSEGFASIVGTFDVIAPYATDREIAQRKMAAYRKRMDQYKTLVDRGSAEISRARIFFGRELERDLWILSNFFDRANGALMQIEQYHEILDVRRQFEPGADSVDFGDGVILNQAKANYCWKVLLFDAEDDAHVVRTIEPAFEKLEDTLAKFVRDGD